MLCEEERVGGRTLAARHPTLACVRAESWGVNEIEAECRVSEHTEVAMPRVDGRVRVRGARHRQAERCRIALHFADCSVRNATGYAYRDCVPLES